MQLAIDPLDVPLGTAGWEDDVARDLAPAYACFDGGELEAGWAHPREVARVALQRAEAALAAGQLDVHHEALRRYRRHDGIWRGAKKMVSEAGGKQRRAIVPVRSDAGDSSCPSFLAREANNRVKAMKVILQACGQAGYTIGICRQGPFERSEVKSKIAALTASRQRLAAVGLDIHVVPAADLENVNLVILGAFAGFLPSGFNRAIHWESVYGEMLAMCKSAGPARWINMHIDNAVSGIKLRSRITSGVFYGAEMKALIEQVAEATRLPSRVNIEVQLAQVKIADALALAEDAAKQGDQNVCVRALQFAKCYAEDVGEKLEAWPIVKLALQLSTEFDLTGLDDSAVLQDVHARLMDRLGRLPLPAPRASAPLWRCVGFLTINGPQDIRQALEWVKTGN